MANVRVGGPKFQVESDRAMIVLGHSERKEVGEFLARALDERQIFEDIDLISLNKSAAWIGRASVRRAMESRTVITRSAGIMRVPKALQVVAINPPEPVPLIPLLKRALFEVPSDPIQAEEEAHKTGLTDQLKAGWELARSPVVTVGTTLRIAKDYSTAQRLIHGAEDFPAGRAMVHSQLDTFGFANLADIEGAVASGVTMVVLPNHYHNEILFAPNRTLDLLTPVIFPETNTLDNISPRTQ